MSIATLLLIIALILVTLAAFGVSGGRVSLGWLGIAFVIAAVLVGNHVLS